MLRMSSQSIFPGHVFGDRYVVRRPISSGGSVSTYEAEDRSLHRAVAVRVLVPELLADPQLHDRFRIETAAVSALHHPNLTSIYDWGEEEGATYVVTELLTGGSLRDILATRGRLSLEQTAMIGLEAATALAYAHARGFVHGALRPSKLLFDVDGRVRVGDLGIASTLAGSEIAHPLEEARYLSPEQVIGAPLDGRTDVYALSLILFECLTGEVPHDGPTSQAARSNRLGTPLPQRSELGPLDLILALGAAPDLTARPDATLFASRLESVAMTLPVPRPVTLSSENSGSFRVPSANEVLLAPAVASARPVGDELTGEPVVRPFDLPGYRENYEAAATSAASATRAKKRGRLGVLVTATVVVVAAIGGAVAWKLGLFTPKHTVPSLIGVTDQTALSLVSGDNFTIAVTNRVASSSVPAGDIVSQSPVAGSDLASGGTIKVTVSSGPSGVSVPTVGVVGEPCAVAEQTLTSLGLSGTCTTAGAVKSATIPLGNVAGWTLGSQTNPSRVPTGAALTLIESAGNTTSTTTTTTTPSSSTGPRPVPNIIGMNRAQTLAAMKAAGLYYATVGPGSQNATWTTVVSTSPAPGTVVAWHSSVTVTVR